jgi:uncharacterized protein (TIGR03437 family)
MRVATNPPGLKVVVDGQEYSVTTSFFWEQGTSHTFSVQSDQINDTLGARYTFAGWVDSTGRQYGSSATITVTADPSIWSVTAGFEVEYLISTRFFECAYGTPSMCGDLPGTLYINGVAYWKDVFLWLAAGTQMRVEAAANPGFAFTGWNNRFANPQLPVQTFLLNAQWMLEPRFVKASRVTVASSPPGLKVVVDSAVVTAPRDFDWAGDSQHSLGPVSPQADAAGNFWMFDSWSIGSAEQQVFTVRPILDPQIVTASYVRGLIATILTEPGGLRVTVDGTENWPLTNLIWAAGSTHRLSAPLEQTGRDGRRYVFRSWSDGNANAARDVTAGEAAVSEGFRIAARYEMLGRLTVESSPAGLKFLAEGAECLTPCSMDRPAGTRIGIVAPASAPVAEDTRLDFEGWQDQGPRERVWTMTAEAQRITASYRTMHRLRAVADPAGGARFRFDPAAADGFYAAGAAVLVTAEAQPGFRFRRWGGDLEGTFPSGALTISQPRMVIARLDRVPHIVPAGVANAAAVTPQPAVAPGSIIAIYGASLALETEAGPLSPLAQTLAEVTVQVDDRLLPLFFVSPEQINALLPSDLAEGDHRLTVRCAGLPEVSATFTVARNAPGLFVHLIDSLLYAAALHEDGTLILPSSPARRGELITLLGTGFGPYWGSPTYGFAIPRDALFPLLDAVELLAGDLKLTPEWAGAAPGYIGVTAIRLRISQQMELPGPLQLRARVNGRESNTILLPLE